MFAAPKGKLPYVKFPHGKIMGDSNLIYKHLISEKKIDDLDDDLTPLEKLHANTFRIFVEEWAHWLRIWDLWILNFYKTRPFLLGVAGMTSYPLQVMVGWYAYRRNKTMLYEQGVGRHSEEDIKGFIAEAAGLMATFINEEPRLADVGRPCLVQASLFGLLLSLYRARSCSTAWKAELDKRPELERWTRKMAQKYYPERPFPV
jgi:glutathione S-transferase